MSTAFGLSVVANHIAAQVGDPATTYLMGMQAGLEMAARHPRLAAELLRILTSGEWTGQPSEITERESAQAADAIAELVS